MAYAGKTLHININFCNVVEHNIIFIFLFIEKLLREKKFEQNIPRVVIDDAEKIAYEDAEKALRRGILYMAALQADDGHWPAENSGCTFFIAPFVSYMFYYSHN